MLQTLSYCIYLIISSFITIYAGWKCYKHGFAFLLYLVKDNGRCKAINKLLLLGYYLLNIGYIAWSLNTWEPIQSWQDALHIIASKIGFITILLCLLHYINMSTIY